MGESKPEQKAEPEQKRERKMSRAEYSYRQATQKLGWTDTERRLWQAAKMPSQSSADWNDGDFQFACQLIERGETEIPLTSARAAAAAPDDDGMPV